MRLRVRVRKRKVHTEMAETILLPILEPHKVIHYLFTSVGLEIPRAHVLRFWHLVRDLGQEPWTLVSPASDEHIPLGIYGDSCKVHGGEKQLGLFISLPLWRPKSARLSRFLVATIQESRLWGCETLDTILAAIVQSVNYLFDGKDAMQNQIAGGRVFACTELRGDWLFHKSTWHFSSSWLSAKNICYLCDAKGRDQDPNKLFWKVDGNNWHFYNRLEFITCQLGQRARPCPLPWTCEFLLGVGL